MNDLPMKRTAKYTYPTNTKLEDAVGRDMETLDQNGIDVGELRRKAITDAVKKAILKLNRIAG